VLRRPLAILLSELCGTEERSSFWTVWSMVMMIALPLLFVSMARIATDPTELIQGTVGCSGGHPDGDDWHGGGRVAPRAPPGGGLKRPRCA
jgi:hypothetical protein